jgi:hypothetical protein
LFLYFVVTNNSQDSTNSDNISTAENKYPPQLFLKSIINQFTSFFSTFFNAFLNSSAVSSPNIFNAMYQILSSSKYFSSIEGIFIFHLVTSISRASFSQDLKIFNKTFVPAGHFILATASNKFNLSNFSQLASVIISLFLIQNFSAGEPFKTLSTFTQKSNLSTTAQIPSKSQDNILLKSCFSFLDINSECLSHKAETSHFEIQSTKSCFFIHSIS